jgi:DNA-binding MarR family transcriptional regulator
VGNYCAANDSPLYTYSRDGAVPKGHLMTGASPHGNAFDVSLETVDPLTAQVFQAFRNAGQLHRQLMLKKVAQKGGHPAEVFCLRILAHDDGISQKDLADRLNLSRPWITKMLQALEKAGMVARRPDEQDQRLTRVYLTPQGRKREAELRAAWADYLNQTVGSMSEHDRRELTRMMNELAEKVSALLSESGGRHE